MGMVEPVEHEYDDAVNNWMLVLPVVGVVDERYRGR